MTRLRPAELGHKALARGSAGAATARNLVTPTSAPPLLPPPLLFYRNPCSEGGLQFVGDLVGHEGMLRELEFGLSDQPHQLHSCAADGTVRGWDTRSGQQVER